MKYFHLRRDGFTLLELLLVCAVIGIVTAVGTVNLRGATNRARVSESATQIIADLQRARSNAQRFNQNSTLVISGSPATSYALTTGGVTRTRRLASGVQLVTVAASRSFTYSAPYGLWSGTDNTILTVRLSTRPEISQEIRVVGVTGKAYQREID